MFHSTYFAYGVNVSTTEPAWAEAERLDKALTPLADRCPDVGYLTAGDYDRDRVFLTTQCDEVDLGDYKHVTPETVTPEQLADWDRQLAVAVAELGYADSTPAGWLCVPDLS
jgi:hypothetical protein